jgi:hypothetical protein
MMPNRLATSEHGRAGTQLQCKSAERPLASQDFRRSDRVVWSAGLTKMFARKSQTWQKSRDPECEEGESSTLCLRNWVPALK